MSLITISGSTSASVSTCWACYTTPEHITQWNFAHESWCCPNAVVNLSEGGNFSWRMEAVDGSTGFDFSGKYNAIDPGHTLSITLDDGRSMEVRFTDQGTSTEVTIQFETENQNPIDLQRQGWQAILDNYLKHTATV